MVPLKRRRLLQAAGGSMAAMAGCTGWPDTGVFGSERNGRRDPPGERNATTTVPGFDGNARRDLDAYVLRAAVEGPIAWYARAGWGTTEERSIPKPDGDSTPPMGVETRGLIADEETARRLRFADVDGARSAREFVDATDFGSETLYVHSRPVRSCFRLVLCYARWTSTEVETQYGRYLRDADVDCSVDSREMSTWLIRFPEVLHPSSIRSRGSGTSGGGCSPDRRHGDDRRETGTEIPAAPAATDGTEVDG